MGILELLEQLDNESSNWTDELGIDFTERNQSFRKAFFRYAILHDLKLDVFTLTKARFLFFYFWFSGETLGFGDELARQVKPYLSSFGRLTLAKSQSQISVADANFVAEGISQDAAFRTIVMALISEHTRHSRQLLALKLNQPINLGPFFMIFAALHPSKEELALHEAISETSIPGETVDATRKCQMGECANWASWVVICPHGDGREYLCDAHKTQDDLSFETYRLIFSNSCGHHAERRDCEYQMVGDAELMSQISKNPNEGIGIKANWSKRNR